MNAFKDKSIKAIINAIGGDDTNGLGKYVVTKCLDYEYQKYSERKIFSDKDLAADYAWKLFGGDEEFKKFLDKNK